MANELEDEAPSEEAINELAVNYVEMIVEKYRATGMPMVALGGALVFYSAKILTDEGMSAEGVAESFEAMAETARNGGTINSTILTH